MCGPNCRGLPGKRHPPSQGHYVITLGGVNICVGFRLHHWRRREAPRTSYLFTFPRVYSPPHFSIHKVWYGLPRSGVFLVPKWTSFLEQGWGGENLVDPQKFASLDGFFPRPQINFCTPIPAQKVFGKALDGTHFPGSSDTNPTFNLLTNPALTVVSVLHFFHTHPKAMQFNALTCCFFPPNTWFVHWKGKGPRLWFSLVLLGLSANSYPTDNRCLTVIFFWFDRGEMSPRNTHAHVVCKRGRPSCCCPSSCPFNLVSSGFRRVF